jgi:hypothetical protein
VFVCRAGWFWHALIGRIITSSNFTTGKIQMTSTTLTAFQIAENAYDNELAGRPDLAIIISAVSVVFFRDRTLQLALYQNGVIDIGNALQLTEDLWTSQAPLLSSNSTIIDISALNIASFNCDQVRFEFEGDDIQDPTMSECGRFDRTPDHFGFQKTSAGIWWKRIEGEDTLILDGTAFARANPVGEFVGRVLLSEVAFDCEYDPDANPTDHLPETLARAARTSSGMVEYAVPSLSADAIAKGFKLGLFEVIGNGLARITAKGKDVATNGTVK